MQIKIVLVLFSSLIAGSVNAQGLLKGTVYESGSGNKLSNVFIRDNSSKQLGLTDKDGNFTIKTETGHLLIFDCPGYVSDTLYLVDLAPKKVEMITKTIALGEVKINSRRQAFDPHKEYPEIYTKSKLYVLSPTTWFGKEATNARRLKKYFKREEEERKIDAVFTKTYVGSIVPLKGTELDDFMLMYRPTYAFIKGNNNASLAVYINDSYKKYAALPPEKRKPQSLTGGN